METPNNTICRHFLFALIPVFLSILLGLVFVWQQSASSTNISFVFLMILLSMVSSYFMWTWHSSQLETKNIYQQKTKSEELNVLMSYTVDLERLLLLVEPKIVDQVVAARELTEQEISTLIRRFSVIHSELNQIFDFANQTTGEQKIEGGDNLRNSVEKIREEINVVLEALQFQDRISQILVLVQDNLAMLRETLEKIQQQGPERHQKMLKVEEILTNIQIQYETVNNPNNHSASVQSADELTLF